MKKIINSLQLNILYKHIGPLLFCFFTVMFLLLMQFLMNHIDKLVGKGIPFGVIVELILSNLAYMVVLAMPMAVLVASLMAFGRFSETNEYAALTATGVNPFRVIFPVICGGVFLSVFLMWFSDQVLPDANQKARTLFIDIRLKEPGFDLKPNVFYDGIKGYVFLVKDINNETDSLYNVTLFQEKTRERDKAVVKADKGYLRSENKQTITLLLYDGTITNYRDNASTDEGMTEHTNFGKYRISFDISEMAFSRSDTDKRSRNDRTMTSRAMLALVDTLRNEIQEKRENSNAMMRRVVPNLNLGRTDTTSTPISNSNSTSNTDSVTAIRRNSPATMESIPPPFQPHNTTTQQSRVNAKKDTTDSANDSLVVLETFGEDVDQSIFLNAQSGMSGLKSSYNNLKVKVDWNKKRIAQYMVEVHKKFSIPMACVVFVLIGAPLGLLTRKGNIGFAAIISAILLTFYWVSIIQGEKLADRMFISPAMGMWFSDALLGLIGIGLITHICTPYQINRFWR